jgi:uncharacterized protein YjdB
MFRSRIIFFSIVVMAGVVAAASNVSAWQSPAVKTIEIFPASVEAEVGQRLKLSVVAKDGEGKTIDLKPAAWVAAPFDVATADETGTVTFYNPGEAMVGVVIGGKTEFRKIRVKPAPVARIEIAPPSTSVVVGGATKLKAMARTANGNPRADVVIGWASDNQSVAAVDAAGLVTGIKPGRATLRATSEKASETITVEVVRDPVRTLTIEPRSAKARTGDVIRFAARLTSRALRSIKFPSGGQ